MAITTTISQNELQRVSEACYEGRYARISLALLGSQGYTAESTAANWNTIKVSNAAYADYIALIQAGAYDAGDARYETPLINASFTSSGAGYSYNRVYTTLGTPSSKTITNTVLNNNVATITTGSTHGFTTGNTVVISGATNSTFNGNYTITGTPTTTTFTYAKTATNIASAASSGTAVEIAWDTYLHSIIQESPAVLISPGQTITYKIQFCTDD